MANTLQIRVDDELKAQAAMVYDQLGIDLSTAVRMFLKKSIAVNGIPFELTNDSTRELAKAAFHDMRSISMKNGNSEMSLDEINEEIAKCRKERSERK